MLSGRALKIPKGKWDQLDRVESDDVFVVLKPGGAVKRQHFTEPELRPLLRQAIVAISAAVESYVAEKASSFISQALDPRPPRLKEVPLTLDDVIGIESKYTRRRCGDTARSWSHTFRPNESSADPNQIGKVFSTVGKQGFWPKVDSHRHVSTGTSERQLSERSTDNGTGSLIRATAHPRVARAWRSATSMPTTRTRNRSSNRLRTC